MLRPNPKARETPRLCGYAIRVDIIIATLLGHVVLVDSLIASNRRRRTVGALILILLLVIVGLRLTDSLQAQKVVSRLLMPVGLVLQLLWLAAVWDAYRGAWRRAALAFFTLVLFTASGAKAVGTRLVAQLENELAAGGTQSSTVALDAVFVLGGGTSRGPNGEVELGRSGDRLRRAAALFHAGRTRRLIASGHSFTDGRDLSAETAALWKEMGIPDSGILTVPKPVNTKQEMHALAALAHDRGWTRIGIVSSAWHLPRAMALAATAGLADVVPLSSNHLVDPVGPASARDWLPTAAGFRQSEVWAWERLGRAVGR